jgi:hypothetical protein
MTNCIEMDTNMDKIIEKPFITLDILKAQVDINRLHELKLRNLTERIHELEKHLKPSDKKQGLTFEQAITAFKNGKKIRLNDGIYCGLIYIPSDESPCVFSYADMQIDHWEIVVGDVR